jgi:RNA 3'-terminal phosphate cyclase (ATP)
MADPIMIDGSQGEGGGQILRTSISLSAITGRPVEIVNIRSKRPNPGLRPSHMTAIKVMADLFHAKVENLGVGSDWVRFHPSGRFAGGSIKVDIGTAGSIPLTLMAVVPAVSLSNNGVEIEITGGTDVKASPTIDYVGNVVSRAYREAGIKFTVEVLKRGYYPKGGGRVSCVIEPCKTAAPVEYLNNRLVEPKIISVCSMLPKHVAERQVSSALLVLEKNGIRCHNYSRSLEQSLSPGSSILVYSVSEFGGPYIGGDSIGEIGKRAEAVGQEAAERFLESSLAGAAVDPHLADMLVLPLSLAKGTSRYRIPRVTEHLRTNLEVASKIVGCKYDIQQTSEKGFLVTITGGLDSPAVK